MNRREFLATASASLGAAALSGPHATLAAGLTARPIPAIDTHIHLYDPSRPEGVPWPPKDNATLYRTTLPARFREVTGPFNIVGTVVVEASGWVEDNAWILDLAERNDEIVGLIGNLKPGRPEFAGHLSRLAANPLFRGIRIRRSDLDAWDQPEALADLGRLADRDLTVDVIGGEAVIEPTLRLTEHFPRLRCVINHLPFAPWDGQPERMRSALAKLAQRQHVYAKISEIARRRDGAIVRDPAFYRPGLDVLLDLFGPDRIVYGSNWPVSDLVAPYADIHGIASAYFAEQPRQVAENYFWRNSLRAYSWQKRGAAARLS